MDCTPNLRNRGSNQCCDSCRYKEEVEKALAEQKGNVDTAALDRYLQEEEDNSEMSD